MKNSADLDVIHTLLDLQNSSYPTQPHSIIAKYKAIATTNITRFLSSLLQYTVYSVKMLLIFKNTFYRDRI